MPLLFQVVAPYQPAGDQPRAIEQLASGLAGQNRQTLLGVTGSGKTFTAVHACQTRRLSAQL